MPSENDRSSVKQLLQEGASAAQVFAALGALPPEEQAAAIKDLGVELRRRLPGHHLEQPLSEAHRALVQVMFDNTPDEEPDTLARLLGARFHLHVGKDEDPQDGPAPRWEAHGLRRMWKVLAALPSRDVEGNLRLDHIHRYTVKPGSQAEGAYTRLTAIIGYDPSTVNQPDHVFAEGPHAGHGEPDPLYGVNAFDETVRHEVGHAVDAQLTATEKHSQEEGWGGWRAYGEDVMAVARAMVEGADSAIHHWPDAAQRERLVKWLAERLDKADGMHLDRALAELDFLDEAGIARLKTDPALRAALFAPVEAQPWMLVQIEGGFPVGGRVYQESYPDRWYSYDHKARERKVSLYQFRSPQEWFAETYAAYYEPAEGEKGQRLKERDPQTWAWIRDNVDRAEGK